MGCKGIGVFGRQERGYGSGEIEAHHSPPFAQLVIDDG